MRLHPATRRLAAAAAGAPRPQPALVACRFAERCSNVACTYAHPVTRPAVCPQAERCVQPGCARLHAGPGVCKFGAGCNKPGCPRVHPDKPAVAGASPSCIYGVQCTNIDCAFDHPAGRPPVCAARHLCTDGNCPQLHPKRNLCKLGAECTVFECTRTHPPARPTACVAGGRCHDAHCRALHPNREKCRQGAACPFPTCAFLHPLDRFPPSLPGPAPFFLLSLIPILHFCILVKAGGVPRGQRMPLSGLRSFALLGAGASVPERGGLQVPGNPLVPLPARHDDGP
jgi:hypothetical protein